MLPSRLAYQTKIEPAAAKSSRSNIQPQNGTGPYLPNNTIIFNLPTRNNLVYVPTESYLKFTPLITNNALVGGADTTFNRFDSCGAHAFIQKIKVFHGSNVLEEIDNYSVLAKMVFDLQASGDSSRGKLNVLAGCDGDMSATNKGEELVAVIAKVGGTNSATTRTYCLNLISIIGTLCNEKYFPLFACTSAPIRVEITLAPTIQNVIASDLVATTSTFSISDVEFIMNTIELSDSAMSTINSSLGGSPLQFTITEYRNQIWTGTGSTSYAVPLPFKFSSIKSIIIAQRDSTTGVGTASKFPISSIKAGLTSYYFRIGPTTMPPKAPSTNEEFFAEAIKAMGSMSDVLYNPAINYDSYIQDTNTTATTVADNVHSGSFYVGLDLENYATADRTSIFAGYNSNTEDIFFYPTYSAAVGIRYDAFCMFDTVLVFENGTCYAKF